MLVGTILNKHAHNFAEFFHARNGTEFVGYSDIKDHVHDLGQQFRPEVSSTASTPTAGLINMTEPSLYDDHHGEFHYPLTPVIATMTLLVGNTKQIYYTYIMPKYCHMFSMMFYSYFIRVVKPITIKYN